MSGASISSTIGRPASSLWKQTFRFGFPVIAPMTELSICATWKILSVTFPIWICSRAKTCRVAAVPFPPPIVPASRRSAPSWR